MPFIGSKLSNKPIPQCLIDHEGEADPVPGTDLEVKAVQGSEVVEEVRAAPESEANLELKEGLESGVAGFWGGRESEANLGFWGGLESGVAEF
ncbi:hypothetical protein SADUNF_Sadunf18G0092700 [Salix dunnii]|uniref:Uncharacterized protein n=1 Tax=Salix dunnii TaxID=1413687 RepID=A0A835J1F2_9ROSI|nr:hypothetical protein SADUNF_Sadunf18G0092700 [Salix dunnii]